MSVICGVFVRQTQITEMQEVLLFSCSTIENRWSSAARTNIYLVIKMLNTSFLLFFSFFYCIYQCVLPVAPSRVWPVIMSRGSSSILTAWAAWTVSLDRYTEKEENSSHVNLVNKYWLSSTTWCEKTWKHWACTGDGEAAFCMRVWSRAVNRCLLMPSVKQSSCSVNEVTGFVGVQHGW